MQAGREVRSFAERGLSGRRADRDEVADNDYAAGDADAAGQLEAVDRSQGGHSGNDVEPTPNGSFGIILVRLRIAKIGEHTIANESRHEAIIAAHAACNLLLVGVDRALQGFEVERCRKARRIDEVAEHHR